MSVTFDKREALCILMHYEIELMNTFGIIALYNIILYQMKMTPKPGTGRHFIITEKFTLTSKIAWNKHGRYKED